MASRAVSSPPLRAVDRFFEFSLLGMLASGYLAVLSSGYLDWPTAALTLAGLCVRGLMAGGAIAFEFSGRLVAALAILYIGFYPLDYLYVSGSFLTATVHLMFFVAVLKVLTARTSRDYAFVKMIAVLELLASAILSASLSFFAFLAMFVLFTIAAFSSGEVRGSAQQRRAVVRSGLGGFGRRLSGLSALLFAGILVMTAGMFFILPRTARAALERFVPQRYHLPGFANEVTLGQIGELKRNNTPVMHVRSYAGEGLLAVRWRGSALADFDGKRWFNPPGMDRPIRVDHGVLALQRFRSSDRPGRTIIYTVNLSDIASDTLFVAGTPETISINLPFVRVTQEGAIHIAPRYGLGALSYGVYSFLPDETAPSRTAPDPLPAPVREEFLQLPAIDPRIPALARRMTTGPAADADEARQLEYRLRHDYGYTLELPATAAPDPLAQFLFVRRKGHCEYFASAMAVMLRTLGIPSRVVTGFQSGVYNPITGWQVIRASDAHSWVEAWIEGRGWTTFDPTPADPSAMEGGLLARASLLLDAAGQFWQEWVLSYNLDRQLVLAARMDESAHRFRFGWLRDAAATLASVALKGAGYAAGLAIAGGMALLALFSAPALGRWWASRLRVSRLARGEGRASDATLLYQRMLALLERRGIQRPPWLTPVEFARVLPSSEMAMVVEDLTAAYNEFRFGGRREVAPRMVRLLDRLESL